MITNYSGVIILTKCTNLLPYFELRYPQGSELSTHSIIYNRAKSEYSRDREVQLILLYRFESSADGWHTYCKIKCPINPLPIRGEFEVVSLTRIIKHLEREGWKFKQKLPISLLK